MPQEAETHPAPGDLHVIPYTPPESLARELGVMFGFIAACLATMALYWFAWQIVQRRNAVKETARREALAARTKSKAAAKEGKGNLHPGEKSDGSTGDISTSNAVRNGSGESNGGSRRVNRNGTSSNGLGFGDVEEDLIV